MTDHNLFDFTKEPSVKEENFKKEKWDPEKAKMGLAFWVLTAIAFFFLLTPILNFCATQKWIDNNFALAFLEICKTGLLPIVTLILGYYFSSDKGA